MVVATQNPIDLEGTYPLPEAQIDSLLVRVGLGYLPRADEAAMLMTHHADRPTATAVVDPERLRQLQELAGRARRSRPLRVCRGIAEHTRAIAA